MIIILIILSRVNLHVECRSNCECLDSLRNHIIKYSVNSSQLDWNASGSFSSQSLARRIYDSGWPVRN